MALYGGAGPYFSIFRAEFDAKGTFRRIFNISDKNGVDISLKLLHILSNMALYGSRISAVSGRSSKLKGPSDEFSIFRITMEYRDISEAITHPVPYGT